MLEHSYGLHFGCYIMVIHEDSKYCILYTAKKKHGWIKFHPLINVVFGYTLCNGIHRIFQVVNEEMEMFAEQVQCQITLQQATGDNHYTPKTITYFPIVGFQS